MAVEYKILPGQAAAEFAAKRFGGPTRLRTINLTVATTVTELFGNNPKRLFWIATNISSNNGVIAFERQVAVGAGFQIAQAGGFMSMDVQDDGEGVTYAVYAINQVAAGLWYGFEIERI